MPGDHPTAPRAGEERAEFPDGIEWCPTPAEGVDEDIPMCARCGSDTAVEWCDRCGGMGVMSTATTDGVALVDCPECNGHGHWYRCISPRAYCEATPLPGREHVASTAREGGEP